MTERTQTQQEEDRPTMRIPRSIYIKVSTDLLFRLNEWSKEPLYVLIEQKPDDTYEMTFKRP